MNKKVAILAYTLAILGIISQLAAFSPIHRTTFNFGYILAFVDTLELSVLDFTGYHNYDTQMAMNFLELAMYCLLLVGAILYTRSHGNEIRLVRFVLAIILINQVYSFFGIVAWYGYFRQFYDVSSSSATMATLGVVAMIAVFVITLNVIKEAQPPRTPEVKTASVLQRFIHHIVDLLMCILLLSPQLQYGGTGLLFLFLIIARLVYYLFFELLFDATPAKFLTECIVVGEDETKPARSTIVLRTLARFIPLEPLSFFGKRGWHDSLTKTKVVNE